MIKRIKLIWKRNEHYHSLFEGLWLLVKWNFYLLIGITLLKLILVGHLGEIK